MLILNKSGSNLQESWFLLLSKFECNCHPHALEIDKFLPIINLVSVSTLHSSSILIFQCLLLFACIALIQNKSNTCVPDANVVICTQKAIFFLFISRAPSWKRGFIKLYNVHFTVNIPCALEHVTLRQCMIYDVNLIRLCSKRRKSRWVAEQGCFNST